MYYTEVKEKNTSELVKYFEQYFFDDVTKNDQQKELLAQFEMEAMHFGNDILNDYEKYEFNQFISSIKERFKVDNGIMNPVEMKEFNMKIIYLLVKVMCREDLEVEAYYDSQAKKLFVEGKDYALFYVLEEFMRVTGDFQFPVDKDYFIPFFSFEQTIELIMSLTYRGKEFSIDINDTFLLD